MAKFEGEDTGDTLVISDKHTENGAIYFAIKHYDPIVDMAPYVKISDFQIKLIRDHLNKLLGEE